MVQPDCVLEGPLKRPRQCDGAGVLVLEWKRMTAVFTFGDTGEFVSTRSRGGEQGPSD